uniref:Uncharacterized protein n=1 Tax=Romanomermis culicivorax TaxID=13658 RepID=A0A915L2L1_ROMCU
MTPLRHLASDLSRELAYHLPLAHLSSFGHKSCKTKFKEPLTPACKCKISPSVRHRPQNDASACRNGSAAELLNTPNISSAVACGGEDSTSLHLRHLALQQPLPALQLPQYPKHFYLTIDDDSRASRGGGDGEGVVATLAPRKICRSLNAFPPLAANNRIQDAAVVVKRWSYNEDKRRTEDPAQRVAFLDDSFS